MSTLQKLIGAGLRPLIRRKARGTSLEMLAEQLATSRDALMPRIRRARDTASNREALNHFVGIERWSLRRLRVAQGEPFQQDVYGGYRMPDTATLGELQDAFAEAREQSIALAREMATAGIDLELKIRHNDLGELNVLEWFTYIDNHTRREIVRIRT